MRAHIFGDRGSWLNKFDYKKAIIIAFLARLIFASIYDIYVYCSSNDILLPDAKFYSINGRYISCIFNGYRYRSITNNMVPKDKSSQAIFAEILKNQAGALPPISSETSIYFYIIGFIYFVFGYFPLGVRIFNIALSIGGTYLIYRVAKRRLGDLPANLFLAIALFLPTQVGYSITFSKDFIRMFMVALILWVIYG